MKQNDEKKKTIDPKVVGVFVVGAACLGIGFVAGRKYEYKNDQYIWKGILNEAYHNGSTELFWEENNGSRTLDFVLSFVKEH